MNATVHSESPDLIILTPELDAALKQNPKRTLHRWSRNLFQRRYKRFSMHYSGKYYIT